MAIVKKRLNLQAPLYTLLLILSVTVFEKAQLQQALSSNDYGMDCGDNVNQLNLCGF